MALSGPEAINKLIARFNDVATYEGCQSDGSLGETVPGASWCTFIDFAAESGYFGADDHPYWIPSDNGTSSWISTEGWEGNIYTYTANSISEVSINYTPDVIWHILQIEVWMERPTNTQPGYATPIGVALDGVEYWSGGANDNHAVFYFDNDVHELQIGGGNLCFLSNCVDGLDRPNRIYAMKVFGTGVSPWGYSNCL